MIHKVFLCALETVAVVLAMVASEFLGSCYGIQVCPMVLLGCCYGI